MSLRRVIIVGGGISGLATAYYLGRRGVSSLLIEKSRRLGGLVQTETVEDCRLEAGPDSYISIKPAVTELSEDLGDLRNQIIGTNDAARRIFVVRSGKLVALPAGMSMMVPGQWLPALRSPLFSFETKLRFLGETFFPPRKRDHDISVEELVSDHLGGEILEYLADPLLAGVYGGDARRLSAESVLPRFLDYERRFGSLIKGVRSEKSAAPKAGLFLSFRDGMQSLTDTLAHAVAASTEVIHAEATVAAQEHNGWRVEAAGETYTASDLVLACPAHACANLIEDSSPELAALLAGIPYSSAILVTLLYRSTRVRHPLDGFGFLVPQRERRIVAAATWINTKFPQRIAPGLIGIRSFIVGAEAVRLATAPDSLLVEEVREDLGRLMGIDAAHHFSAVYRWPNSMPQYIVGHKARLHDIRASLAGLPGLHLVGNAYDGVGLPDCVRLAENTAEHIAAY